MSGKVGRLGLFFAVASVFSAAAQADLPGAQKAYTARDFEGAFQQYLEIATLGNVTAQENLAAMYVDGQGVKRDNVLGYAWAVIARENGGNAAMQNIIDQLQPHLDEKSRARVKALADSYGKEALAERLLPAPLPVAATPPDGEPCRITRPVNPDEFYPSSAVSDGISGSVLVETRVSPDGHAHHPITWYSVPEGVFDAAGRGIGWMTGFAPAKKAGVVQPCSIRFKSLFRIKGTSDARVTEAYQKAKPLAEAGDPVAQLYYGLLMFDREKAPFSEKSPRDWWLKAAQAGIPYAQYLIGVELVHIDESGPGDAKAREIAKGLTWLKLSAANGRPEAKFALANYQIGTHPEALTDPVVFAWLEDAAKAGHRDGTLYLAALLATSPDAQRRDPARALTLVDTHKWDLDSDPTALEVMAAANAQSGKFADAVSLQNRAIRGAERFKWNTASLKARLAIYQAGKAWTGNLLDP